MKKKIVHTCEITSYSSEKELSEDLQILLKKAREALKSSYSPYSGFQVGAALKLSTGEIVLGSNQENIAYPSGLCAERTAIFSAGTNYANIPIESIAIVAKSLNGEVSQPVTPCGACRQVMIEVETKQNSIITMVTAGDDGEIWVSDSIANIIPFYFSSAVVGRVK